MPYSAVGFLLSMSFGIVAREAGFSAVAAIVMSAIVFAGSAQFAAVSIIASGGTAGAAVAAAALMNSRFLPMGIALGPSLPGGPVVRAAQGQAVIDASWAMSNRGDGTFDRWFLFASTAPQYLTWIAGTACGALGGDLFRDPSRFGLDAIYPTFFLALLIAEIKDRTTLAVAATGGLVALSLVQVAPPGLPVLAASLVALWGLRRDRGTA
nr:AzlC family ABC transporter permease [Aeromicrobium wangtongii]